MEAQDKPAINSHLKTLYTGQENLLVWLRDVAAALGDVSQAIRASDLELPQGIRTKLEDLESALDRAQVSELGLGVVQDAKASL
jgi:hypothetical protein